MRSDGLSHQRQEVGSADKRAGIALMVVVFCSAFQFFHSFGKAFETQPLAPYLLLEVTMGALIVLAGVTILMEVATGRLRPLDLFFFGFPVCWLILSSAFAWIAFGQPLIFGVSEDRRILLFLYWFAFDPIRRRYSLEIADILLAVTICAGIYLIVGLALQVLVPDVLRSRALPDLDVRRLRMSAPGDCFAITFLCGLVGCVVGDWRARNLAGIVIGLTGLLQIAQTRQLTLAVLACGLIIVWWWRPMWALMIAAVGIVAFIVAMSLRGPVLFEQVIEALLPNISEFFGSNLADNARINTLGIVTRLLAENYYMGLGAVSLLFDGGLARVYGRDVFVNDVGIFGELFRVGVFYLGFVWVYATMALGLWQRIRLPEHRALIGSLFLFFLMLGPTDGFFYRLGFVHAFLFLLLSAASRSPVMSPQYGNLTLQRTAYQRSL